MKNKNIVARSVNFADWYTSVIKEAKLVEYGPVKGTMFYLPNGWAIWNMIQEAVNKEYAKIGVKNIQLPLFIKQADFMKEKEHVEGFAPELYTVGTNKKDALADPIVIRPTSEITFCQCFKSQIRSFNDLPMLFNQWCAVYRVEKNTRPFLRNTEFHWQELHTVHATEAEAQAQALKELEIYKHIVTDILCIPVLAGEKTENERFAGAVHTYTLESMMQDGQALQSCTAHYLGQNFAKAYDVKFQTKDNTFDYVYQTSAGLSTRIIGGLIMSHSDDNGLVLPFKIAPTQIAILGVKPDESVINYTTKLYEHLSAKYRVVLDNSDKGFGFKINTYQTQGVPYCLIVGGQEAAANVVTLVRRDSEEKVKVELEKLDDYIKVGSYKFDKELFDKANTRLQSNIVEVNNIEEFKKALEDKKFALAYFDDTVENEKKLKAETGATARVIKLAGIKDKTCFYTGKPATHLIYFARAY